MTDLVARLRDFSKMTLAPVIVDEAADEIERLRAEAKHALAAYQGQFNEIERLRDLLSDQRDEHALKAKAEIERLRALALKFLHEQTEANADALRAACEVRQ